MSEEMIWTIVGIVLLIFFARGASNRSGPED